jgi:hypothetical protein|tara:strand:+ start:304 stop:501 length:198 start_codon:yes stop_codon:yes gene_type:complete
MKYLFVAAVILVIFLISNRSGYLISKGAAYKDCMARVESDYITKKGADHIAAQCKAFVLKKIMVK